MKLTIEQLQAAVTMRPESARLWIAPINRAGELCRLTTPRRWAMWLAQCGHECLSFTRLVESLNYTSEVLLRTWPGRYTDHLAKQHGRSSIRPADQKAIANHVYGDRMGNRAGTDDGWSYRGRGALMLTGRDNYRTCGKHLDVDLLSFPDLLAEDRYLSAASSAWFWDTRDINRYADTDDLDGATRKINGGTHGIQDRRHRYALAKTVLEKAVQQQTSVKLAEILTRAKQP